MKMLKIATAGNKGEKIRSDCYIELEITDSGGIQIDLKSKVIALYGKDIRDTCKEVLSFYGIKDAKLKIEDTGALPFVLTARLEAAIKQLTETDKEFLLPFSDKNSYPTSIERARFSRLYLPGNTPVYVINAGIHQPDAIILDLEDSVAYEKKNEARILVRNAMRNIDFFGVERMTRINPIPEGLLDLKYLIPHNVHVILVPKCESAEQIIQIEKEIKSIKADHSVKQQVFLMPIIESALGIECSFKIASSSPNIIGMAIGLEDYTSDIGVSRTNEGQESLYARMRLINACKAARIQAFDSVFSDVEDTERLLAYAQKSRSLGFEGMGCIHPKQIPVIHRGFTPDHHEIEKAREIIQAFNKAKEKGTGVISIGSKMIDAPVVKRAEKIINMAVKLGLISNDWRTRYE